MTDEPDTEELQLMVSSGDIVSRGLERLDELTEEGNDLEGVLRDADVHSEDIAELIREDRDADVEDGR